MSFSQIILLALEMSMTSFETIKSMLSLRHKYRVISLGIGVRMKHDYDCFDF